MIWQAEHPPLVLASESAARRELLLQASLRFVTDPARIDEAAVKASARSEGASAAETALLLADLKSQAVARRSPDALVISADQLLVCGDEWFDKPQDAGEARDHLLRLRGRTHELVTAVCCRRSGARLWHHIASPRLRMRSFSDGFLDAYLEAEGAALTATVGGYRVEGPGIQLFDQIEGEDAAIRGLPLLALLGFLRQHGVLLG